jgi:adenylate cyclase
VETCRRALDAAAETMRELAAVNARAPAAGLPHVTVDLALHVGEVLYGNVGAVDRLDFTVIGPAVNEIARIEALCEPLGRTVLISAEFAASVEDVEDRLKSLGHYNLRGVRETKKIFGLASGAGPN